MRQNRTEQRFSGIIRASAHHCNVAAVFERKRVRAIEKEKRERQTLEFEFLLVVRSFGGALAGLMCIYVCT